MFDLKFSKHRYGKVLLNPIGDDIFITNDKFEAICIRIERDIILSGEATLELIRDKKNNDVLIKNVKSSKK